MKRSAYAALVLSFAGSMLVAGCTNPATGKGDQSGAGETMKSTDELQVRDGPTIDVANHPGKGLFETNCASCHEGGVPKAPTTVWLEMMAPDAILGAMNGGLMTQQAAALSAVERRQIAEYLTRTPLDQYKPPAPPPQCSGSSATFDAAAPPAKVGWGHDNSRFTPVASGGMAAADVPGLKLKWAFAYPAAQRARSQPTVGWGAIFVGSQDGTVYAFDLAKGCARWTFRASAEVRTAIVADPATKRLYFGDVLARAYALDAMTGKLLWKRKIDDHPNATITGTPTLGGGQLFVPVSSLEVTSAANPAYACCTFRGQVVALDPRTGQDRWRAYTVAEPARSQGKTSAGTEIMGPSGAPVWNSPSFDAATNRVYFGSGENYSTPADANSDAVFAVDARSGKRIWVTQLTKGDAWNVGCMMGNANCPREHGPDLDVAASPLLVALPGGKRIVVVGQKSGEAYGLDPGAGKALWRARLGHGGTQGGVHFGMAAEGSRVYVPINDMADTKDGRVYDVKLRGAGLHAIDAATGRVLWRQIAAAADCNGRKFCDPGISSAASAIPGAVFAGHLSGWLRGYDANSGKVIWAVDTTVPVKTVTGVMAHGGGMSGPGPTVANGYLVVNSGYGLYYHMPGNLLMVFAKDGR